MKVTLGTWKTKTGEVKATYSDGLGLAIWDNGQLSACHLHIEVAQAIVNRLVERTVWGEA